MTGVVGEVERGEVEAEPEAGEEGTSDQSEESVGKMTGLVLMWFKFELCDHDTEVLLEAEGKPCMLSSSGVCVRDVVDEGAVCITDKGGRMLKIWSSD